MAIRQGKDYLERIANDGREVWCNGVRVADITTDPRFSGGARTMDELYDLHHDPKLTPILTVKAAEGDGIFGLSDKQPRTTEDLIKRRQMFKVWNNHTCEICGRSPDIYECNDCGKLCENIR